MAASATTPIGVASRISGFVYAIRNIVAEARRVEAAGTTVRYLNIGDPITFGFKTPPHLVEAVERAIQDGHNGYAPSVGIVAAREAVADECTRRGMPLSADRVVLTSGTSEGIELALTALAEAGDDVLVPVPTYPLYTAVLAKIGARAVFYRTDPARGWLPDLDHIRSLITPATRALVAIDPNNPTGAVYPPEVRRALVDIADEHGLALLADEVYADLAFDGPVAAIATHNPDAPVITFSSLSKAYLAPGWRAGWMAVGRSPRLDDVLQAVKKLADGRLCATGPMEYAITAALNGDRTHQEAFRTALRVRAELTTSRLNAIEGITVVPPTAAFYAMPQVALPAGTTDEDYVLGLLRATGVLCVYGSGFGARPDDGFFRIVFLASPGELASIYDDIGRFTAEFLSGRRASNPVTLPASDQKAVNLWTIWMTALAVVVLWAAYLVRDVLLLVYMSGLLAVGFSPIVRLIERQRFLPIGTRRFPRWLAILVLYLFIIGVLVGIGFLIVPPLVHQGQQLWGALPDMLDRGQEFLVRKGLLSQPLTIQEAMARAPVSKGGDAVGTVFGAIVGLVGGLFGFLTILILTFYLLVEADQLRATMVRLFPAARRARVGAVSRDITVKVSAWLGGQLGLGAIIGTSSAVGLWLIGVPFFYVLALISGIGELIPVVGPILSAIPAIAVASTISLKTVLFVIIFFVVQQQFENHVLVPKVMARQVGVSAVTVIVSLLIGGKLLGMVGAILAVPTAAILQVLFTELTGKPDEGRTTAARDPSNQP